MRHCKVCGAPFEPVISSLQATCSVPCHVAYGAQLREKKIKSEIKIRKAALKTISDHRKDAKKALHAYVREIHVGMPCISCGTILERSGKPGGDFDAGHYRAVGGAKHLELDIRNLAGQCKRCNRRLGGNYVAFRQGLIVRFGRKYVEDLDNDHVPRRYRSADYQAITKKYKDALKHFRLTGERA